MQQASLFEALFGLSGVTALLLILSSLEIAPVHVSEKTIANFSPALRVLVFDFQIITDSSHVVGISFSNKGAPDLNIKADNSFPPGLLYERTRELYVQLPCFARAGIIVWKSAKDGQKYKNSKKDSSIGLINCRSAFATRVSFFISRNSDFFSVEN